MPQDQIFPINPTEVPILKFQGVTGFSPHYTPRDMLLLGVFNGTFFNTMTSRKGLPKSLWDDMAYTHFEQKEADSQANFFRVSVPTRNRAIEVPVMCRLVDPGGWYQWYCKFYYGRRMPEMDPFRIEQWRKEIVTLFHYIKFGEPENLITPGDPYVPPVGQTKIEDITQFKTTRQQLLHYGWDSRIDPLTMEIRL